MLHSGLEVSPTLPSHHRSRTDDRSGSETISRLWIKSRIVWSGWVERSTIGQPVELALGARQRLPGLHETVMEIADSKLRWRPLTHGLVQFGEAAEGCSRLAADRERAGAEA